MSKFTNVVATTLKIDESEVKPELALGSIETWDSLNHIHLIFALEEAFSVRFDTEEIPNLKTISSLQKALDEKRT